jgi:hypothetical protein
MGLHGGGCIVSIDVLPAVQDDPEETLQTQQQ